MTDPDAPGPSEASMPPSDETLAALFHRTARLMARAAHRHDFGHHAQTRVLGILLERGPMVQADLLDLLDVRSSSLSELLTKLTRLGLVTRTRNDADRRGFIVSATPLAAASHREQATARRQAGDAFFDCLDADERGRLRRILEKIIAARPDEPPCEAETPLGPRCSRWPGGRGGGRHGGGGGRRGRRG